MTMPLEAADDDDGEIVDLGEEDYDVEDTDDGGAYVTIGSEPDPEDGEFYSNLAETLPELELKNIAMDLIELIEKDKESRKKRDEQYAEGIRRTGLGDDAPGGAQFNGASRVVHPVLTEACVDFSARVMKEIWPPEGPVKDKIIGDHTKRKVEKAKRKTECMNWQLTEQSPEFRAELEQAMTQLPLAGAGYVLVYQDLEMRRLRPQFYPMDEVYLPYAATSFYGATRKTLVDFLTEVEFQRRIDSGQYREVDLMPTDGDPTQSAAAKANDKVEGRSSSAYNEDGLRQVYKCFAWLEVPGADASFAPYIIEIDEYTSNVLSLYRNWEEEDPSRLELEWVVEFPFVPWRGAYPIGLTHMIGGLSGAATGALRALLDSAHINNFPGMMKLKGGSSGGQSDRVMPTEVKEIEGGLNIDDIRKLAMPMPFNPPSLVLYQLLEFVVSAAKGVVQTTFEDFPDANPNTPVGTTMARIEQRMVVFSSIHSRLHNAMARLLKITSRLNGVYLDDGEIRRVGLKATRRDFQGPMDVAPVSDPNIFSEAQRFAQTQLVAQRADLKPQLYNQRAVEKRILTGSRIVDGDELLVKETEARRMNAVNENVAASMGSPIVAFPTQDHLAHLQVHLNFMVSPIFGFNPLFVPTFVGPMLGHVKEHLALWYVSAVHKMVSDAAGEDAAELMDDDDDVSADYDGLLADASPIVIGGSTQLFQALPPVIEQAMKLLQSMQPQMPMDPMAQAAMADSQLKAKTEQEKIAAKAQETQARVQTDQQKVATQAEQAAQELALEQERLAQQSAKDANDAALREQELAEEREQEELRQRAEDIRKAMEMQTRERMNQADNDTARQLALWEIESGERVAVSTGTGINPNP